MEEKSDNFFIEINSYTVNIFLKVYKTINTS